jgi:TonB family protein
VLKKDLFYSSLLALLLHTVIFAIFFIYSIDAKQNTNYSAVNSIPAFLYHPPHLQSRILTSNKSTQKKSRHLLKNYNNITAPASITNRNVNIQTMKNNDSTLLQMLHTKIQQVQQYPAGALLLHQSGSVRVYFRLFPDGHVEGLKIINSSHIVSLDNAALAAVSAITPVAEAHTYLTQVKEFYIDIEFQINS